jgi:hypothetical protein
MKSRKVLLALAVAATALGGCATYPYDDPNYAYYQNPDGPYYRDYYGRPYYPAYPGYYVGPSVGFGITYSDRHYHRH